MRNSHIRNRNICAKDTGLYYLRNFRKDGNSMDATNAVREIPIIQCILSVSFPDEETARDFAAEIDLLTGKSSRVFKPRLFNEWLVDAVCMRDKSWDLDEVVSKLFESIDKVKNQIMELIVQYRGEVVIDIAVYETDTYPALIFSQETIQNIGFFSASVGIDLV